MVVFSLNYFHALQSLGKIGDAMRAEGLCGEYSGSVNTMLQTENHLLSVTS